MSVLAFLLKNWKLIVIGLMMAIIITLSNFLVGSYKSIGTLKEQLAASGRANGLLIEQRNKAYEDIKNRAAADTSSYEVCLNQAETSDSQAFRRGIEVGKVIGKKEGEKTCTTSKR